MTPEHFVGIDVAAATLVIAVWPEQRTWDAANTVEGIEQLVAVLQELTPARIVLEGTGGLQAPLVAALGLAGLPVVVMNPRQIRDFAKGKGSARKPTGSMRSCSRSLGRSIGRRCGPWRIPTRCSSARS